MASELSDRELERSLAEVRRDLAALRADLARVVTRAGDVAEERAEALAKQARHQIAEHPAAATGVAFGLGMLIGFAIARPFR